MRQARPRRRRVVSAMPIKKNQMLRLYREIDPRRALHRNAIAGTLLLYGFVTVAAAQSTPPPPQPSLPSSAPSGSAAASQPLTMQNATQAALRQASAYQ